MNYRVVRTPRATAHVLDIVAYLAEHSDAAATRFLDDLRKADERIATFPNSGAPGSMSGTRRLVMGDYIVSYRVRREVVEIFAVRHAKRRDALP